MNTITPNPTLGLVDSLRSKGFSNEDITLLKEYADATVEKQMRHVIHQELVPVNERITKVEQEMTKGFTQVDKQFVEMNTKFDKQFVEMNTKFDKQFSDINYQFVEMNANTQIQHAQADSRFTKLESKMVTKWFLLSWLGVFLLIVTAMPEVLELIMIYLD